MGVEAEARAAAEPRLLEGEDPDTDDPEAARSWVVIYAELSGFKRDLAARMERALETMAPPARSEIAADLALVRAQLARLEDRLAFWRERQLVLAGLLQNPEEPQLSFGGRTLRMSRREAQLLSFLARNPDASFTAPALAARAWRDPALSAAQVRNYVSRLRQKLDAVQAPCRIEAADGSGYRLTWTTAGQASRP
jgi:DNA-binding response OmpR family regulator